MHSIADLTTFARKTKGDVPPQLVGASTTVVGNKMYLFGGRLVSARRMVSDLYIFDLTSFVWQKLEPEASDDVPGPRYFHSADAYKDSLVIFGGMGYVAPGSDDLCVLNDVRIFDLPTQRWLPPSPVLTTPPDTPSLIPRSRYAHLSSVTSDRLFIIGGQDMTNVWLDDIHVFDLVNSTWVHRQDYPRHCGTYRSVAVAATLRVRLPQEELRGDAGVDSMGLLGPPGSRFRTEGGTQPSSTRVISEQVAHLSYSAEATAEFPNDILLYSNYNFTDVRRELEVISPEHPAGFSITDRSNAMTGVSLPPGLRFPTGAILGSHLIIAGTYLAHSYQSFSIWALDLQSMAWTRIDAGMTLTTGSWSRGVLWAAQNKFLIFGNRGGNLVEDYNRRLLSWDHVACIDLEAFGIYQPPRMLLDPITSELGLAALEEGVLSDFEIVCDDGKIPCSRAILEMRWPWFADERRKWLKAARKAVETLPISPHGDVPVPARKKLPGPQSTEEDEEQFDPRLMSRSLALSESYSVALALLQYIYSLTLLTPLQHSPQILSALLVVSTKYQMPHLEAVVKHAMHKSLGPATSVGVYEVATLCDCQSLQIRALKIVMSSRRPTQSSGTTSRREGGDRDGQQTRPRGMSDANRLQREGSSTAAGGAQSGGEGGGYQSNVSRNGLNSAPPATRKAPTRPPRRPSTADAASPRHERPGPLRSAAEEQLQKLSVDTSSRMISGSKKYNAEQSLSAVLESRLVHVVPVSEDQSTAPYVVISTDDEARRRTSVIRSRAMTESDALRTRRYSRNPASHLSPPNMTDSSAANTEDEDYGRYGTARISEEVSDGETFVGELGSAFPTPPSHSHHQPQRGLPQTRPIFRRQPSDLSATTSTSSSSRRRRAGSDATTNTLDGPLTPAASSTSIGGGFYGTVSSPTGVELPASSSNRTLDRIDESTGSFLPGTTPKISNMTSMPDLRKQVQGLSIIRDDVDRSPYALAQPHHDSELDSLSSDHSTAKSFHMVSRSVTGTSSSGSQRDISRMPGSPTSPGPGKLDKNVEKARRNLEKAERKAREKAEKEAEKMEKKRLRTLAQPSAQELLDRGRYMGVLGFR